MKSTWPGRVDQVQLVALPHHADGLRLDRDPALALEVHRVEQLLAHLAAGDGVGDLEDAVGERRLAVVDVRDDREVADLALVHGHVSVAAASGGAVEPHQPVREAVLLDVADVHGSRPSRTRATSGGSAPRPWRRPRAVRGRRRRRRGRTRRARAGRARAPTRSGSPISRSTPATPGADLDDLLPLRVVRDEVGLDHPDRPAVDDDQEVLGSARGPRSPAAVLASPPRSVAPPARDVVAAEPLLDEREVVLGRAAGTRLQRVLLPTSGKNAARAAPSRRRRSSERRSSSTRSSRQHAEVHGRRRPRARARARRPARRSGGRARRRAAARRRTRRRRATAEAQADPDTELGVARDVEPPELAPAQQDQQRRSSPAMFTIEVASGIPQIPSR